MPRPGRRDSPTNRRRGRRPARRGAGHGEQRRCSLTSSTRRDWRRPRNRATGAGGLATGQARGRGQRKARSGATKGRREPGAPTEVSSIPHVVPAGLGGVAPAASGGITISAAAIRGASVPGAAIPGTGSGAPGAGIAGGETAARERPAVMGRRRVCSGAAAHGRRHDRSRSAAPSPATAPSNTAAPSHTTAPGHTVTPSHMTAPGHTAAPGPTAAPSPVVSRGGSAVSGGGTAATSAQLAFISAIAPGAIAAQQALWRPRAGNDRPGDRRIRVGAERPRDRGSQPVRHQGDGSGGHRHADRRRSSRTASGLPGLRRSGCTTTSRRASPTRAGCSPAIRPTCKRWRTGIRRMRSRPT